MLYGQKPDQPSVGHQAIKVAGKANSATQQPITRISRFIGCMVLSRPRLFADDGDFFGIGLELSADVACRRLPSNAVGIDGSNHVDAGHLFAVGKGASALHNPTIAFFCPSALPESSVGFKDPGAD